MRSTVRIVGILLAAGRGIRFGGDKLLTPMPDAPLDVPAGMPLGIAAAMHLVTALPDSLAVVRPGDARLAKALRDARLRTLECANAHDGMGTSLACGVSATHDADGWVVALALSGLFRFVSGRPVSPGCEICFSKWKRQRIGLETTRQEAITG